MEVEAGQASTLFKKKKTPGKAVETGHASTLLK
jgi:hypothetical protein